MFDTRVWLSDGRDQQKGDMSWKGGTLVFLLRHSWAVARYHVQMFLQVIEDTVISPLFAQQPFCYLCRQLVHLIKYFFFKTDLKNIFWITDDWRIVVQRHKSRNINFTFWNPCCGLHLRELSSECIGVFLPLSFYFILRQKQIPQFCFYFTSIFSVLCPSRRTNKSTAVLWRQFHQHNIQVKTFTAATLTLWLDSDSCRQTKQ